MYLQINKYRTDVEVQRLKFKLLFNVNPLGGNRVFLRSISFIYFFSLNIYRM